MNMKKNTLCLLLLGAAYSFNAQKINLEKAAGMVSNGAKGLWKDPGTVTLPDAKLMK